jgi:nicotinamidase-related amidase
VRIDDRAGAANLGYRTIVVGDATATFDLVDTDGRAIPAAELHRAHLATLHAEFATVMTTAAVLSALESACRSG